jgi:hypothetical protein
MKIKIYILTYDSEYHINDNLDSLFSSDLNHDLEINIINNHTNLKINEENKKRLNDFGRYRILNNVMQCDWSWGYTTRNWNQALILGFKSLKNPECDLVVCAQDDTNYYEDWVQVLKDRHAEGLEFIACGVGDCLCSYTPNAVKSIGLWDERFCTLNWSEHDYFLRASSWLGYKAAIDDQNGLHGLMYRFNGEKADGIARKPNEKEDHGKGVLRQIRQNVGDRIGSSIFRHKWGYSPGSEEVWSSNNVGNERQPISPVFINYPYFELDIPDLNKKGYIVP